ncbi:MAG: MarR family transcriptional regulator [Bacteroidales bacterium]|jgi:DNA-binding MarR family transcriptional regulator|nr:MarR family transcriptional regulator [Bacteroidales bacterium]
MYSIEELINIILSKSEHIEELAKQTTDLKNLTTKQLNCIEMIHSMENPTLSELTEKLKITKASTSVMLDRLEEHGFIQKVKSDNDRRSAHVHLTDKGNKAAHLHTDVHKQFASLLTKELTNSEKDILIVLLNKAIMSIE